MASRLELRALLVRVDKPLVMDASLDTFVSDPTVTFAAARWSVATCSWLVGASLPNRIQCPLLTRILVLGNDDSTAYASCPGLTIFPGYGHSPVSQLLQGISLCRRPHCQACAESAETAVLHIDCFKLFVRGCKSKEVMQRLWIVTSWRSPWRAAPDLRLEETTSTAIVPSTAAEQAGFARLTFLPPEIVRVIRDSSESSLLWAYGSAMRLASQMSDRVPCRGLVSAPLLEVSSWERGSPPLLTAQPLQSTICSHSGLKWSSLLEL